MPRGPPSGDSRPGATLMELMRSLTTRLIEIRKKWRPQSPPRTREAVEFFFGVSENTWSNLYDDSRLHSAEGAENVMNVNLVPTVCSYLCTLNALAGTLEESDDSWFTDAYYRSTQQAFIMLEQLISLGPRVVQAIELGVLTVLLSPSFSVQPVNISKHILFERIRYLDFSLSSAPEDLRLLPSSESVQSDPELLRYYLALYRGFRPERPPTQLVDSINTLFRMVFTRSSSQFCEMIALWGPFLLPKAIPGGLAPLELSEEGSHAVEEIAKLFESLFHESPALFHRIEERRQTIDFMFRHWEQYGESSQLQLLSMSSHVLDWEPSQPAEPASVATDPRRPLLISLLRVFRSDTSTSFDRINTFLINMMMSTPSIMPLLVDVFLPSLVKKAMQLAPRPPFDQLVLMLHSLISTPGAYEALCKQDSSKPVTQLLISWIGVLPDDKCLNDLFEICEYCQSQPDSLPLSDHVLSTIGRQEIRVFLLEHLMRSSGSEWLLSRNAPRDLLKKLARTPLPPLPSDPDATPLTHVFSASAHPLVGYSFLLDYLLKLSALFPDAEQLTSLVSSLLLELRRSAELAEALFPLVLSALMGKITKRVPLGSEGQPSAFQSAALLPLVAESLMQRAALLSTFLPLCDFQENAQFLSHHSFLSLLLGARRGVVDYLSRLTPLQPLLTLLYAQGLSPVDLRALLRCCAQAGSAEGRAQLWAQLPLVLPPALEAPPIPRFSVLPGGASLNHRFGPVSASLPASSSSSSLGFSFFAWIPSSAPAESVLFQLNQLKVSLSMLESSVSMEGSQSPLSWEAWDRSHEPLSSSVAPSPSPPSIPPPSAHAWRLVSAVYSGSERQLTVSLDQGLWSRRFEADEFLFLGGDLQVVLCPPTRVHRHSVLGCSMVGSQRRSISRSLGMVGSSASMVVSFTAATAAAPSEGDVSLVTSDDPLTFNSLGLYSRPLSEGEVSKLFLHGPYRGALSEGSEAPPFPDLWFVVPCAHGTTNLSFGPRNSAESESFRSLQVRSYCPQDTLDSLCSLGGLPMLYRLLRLSDSEPCLELALAFVDAAYARLALRGSLMQLPLPSSSSLPSQLSTATQWSLSQPESDPQSPLTDHVFLPSTGEAVPPMQPPRQPLFFPASPGPTRHPSLPPSSLQPCSPSLSHPSSPLTVPSPMLSSHLKHSEPLHSSTPSLQVFPLPLTPTTSLKLTSISHTSTSSVKWAPMPPLESLLLSADGWWHDHPLCHQGVLLGLLLSHSESVWFSERCFSVVFAHFDSPGCLTPLNVGYFYAFVLNHSLATSYSFSTAYLRECMRIIRSVFDPGPTREDSIQTYLSFLRELAPPSATPEDQTLETDPLLCFILSTGETDLLALLFQVYRLVASEPLHEWAQCRFLRSLLEVLAQHGPEAAEPVALRFHVSLDRVALQRTVSTFLLDTYQLLRPLTRYLDASCLRSALSLPPYAESRRCACQLSVQLLLEVGAPRPAEHAELMSTLSRAVSVRRFLASLLLHSVFSSDSCWSPAFASSSSLSEASLSLPARLDPEVDHPMCRLDADLYGLLFSVLENLVCPPSGASAPSLDTEAVSAAQYLLASLKIVVESPSAFLPESPLDGPFSLVSPPALVTLSRPAFVQPVLSFYLLVWCLQDEKAETSSGESSPTVPLKRLALDYLQALFIGLLQNPRADCSVPDFLDELFHASPASSPPPSSPPSPLSPMSELYTSLCSGFFSIVRSAASFDTLLPVLQYFSECGDRIGYFEVDLVMTARLLITHALEIEASPLPRPYHDTYYAIVMRNLRHFYDQKNTDMLQSLLVIVRAVLVELESKPDSRQWFREWWEHLEPLCVLAFLNRSGALLDNLLDTIEFLQRTVPSIDLGLLVCFRAIADHPDACERERCLLQSHPSMAVASSASLTPRLSRVSSQRRPLPPPPTPTATARSLSSSRTLSSSSSASSGTTSSPVPCDLGDFQTFCYARLASHGSLTYYHEFSKRHLHSNSPWGFDSLGSTCCGSYDAEGVPCACTEGISSECRSTTCRQGESEKLHWKLDAMETMGPSLHYRLKRNLNPLLPRSNDLRFENQLLVEHQLDLEAFSNDSALGRELSFALLQFLFVAPEEWSGAPPQSPLHAAPSWSGSCAIRAYCVRRQRSYCGVALFTARSLYFIYNLTLEYDESGVARFRSLSPQPGAARRAGPRWLESSFRHKCLRIAYSSMQSAMPTRYNLVLPALSFKEDHHRPHFFAFPDAALGSCRETLFSFISLRCSLPHLRSPDCNRSQAEFYYGLWRHREISNLEYLLLLNECGGRSNLDLAQYPVFPWVLRDYTSPQLNLGEDSVYRDLSQPMGALDESRQKLFWDKFKSGRHFDAVRGELDMLPSFLYGSHYSNQAYTYHYLIRLEPFGSGHYEFQGKRFDSADRLFYSLEESWLSCSQLNQQDVRELTPEFFYLPDFLSNTNKFDFGSSQSAVPVNDVVLPPWSAGLPHAFVHQHRRALESARTTLTLPNWVDLLFGAKQSGAAAEEARNVFNPMTYEANVRRELHQQQQKLGSWDPWFTCLEYGLTEYGEIPIQLFSSTRPIKKRAALAAPPPLFGLLPAGVGVDAPSSSSSPSSSRPPMPALRPLSTHSFSFFSLMSYVKEHREPLDLQISFERAQPPGHPLFVRVFGGLRLVFGFPNGMYTLSSSKGGGTRYYYSRDRSRVTCVAVDRVPSMIPRILRAQPPTLVALGTESGSIDLLCAASEPSGGELVLRGTLSCGHASAVTALRVSSFLGSAVSLDRSGRVVSWCLSRLCYVRQLRFELSEVCGLALNQLSARVLLYSSHSVQLLDLNGSAVTLPQRVDDQSSRVSCVELMDANEDSEDTQLLVGLEPCRVDFYRLRMQPDALRLERSGSLALPADLEGGVRWLAPWRDRERLAVVDGRGHCQVFVP